MAEGYSSNAGYNGSSDTYDPSELNGKLYGKVTYVTKHYGIIQPFRRLPQPFKKKTVFFNLSKVDGPRVNRKDVLCFKLNLQSHEKPNATWVKVSTNGPPYSEKNTEELSDSEEDADAQDDVYCGIVVKISKHFGFVKPDVMLPPPFVAGENVYFKTPVDTAESVKKGHDAFFTLNIPTEGRPAVGEIVFHVPKDTFTFKHPVCGHICFREKLKSPKVCPKPCSKTISCGHACQKRCSEQCPSKCTSCLETEQPVQAAYTLADLGEVLHGTILEINHQFGYLKPERPLPPLYNAQKDIYFTSVKLYDVLLSEGDPVVYILNKDAHEDPSAAEVAFPRVCYIPTVEIPYKRYLCGHICFQNKAGGQIDVCMKECTTTYSCGHHCSKICSDVCLDECSSCESEDKEQAANLYTLDDLDELLYGTVVDVYDDVGLIKPDSELPPALYVARTPVFFFPNIPDNANISVGDRVVFELTKDNCTAPTASKITVIDEDSECIEMTPYIRSQCGHICFVIGGSTQLCCSKPCSQPLPCGHPCTRKCSEPCLPTCYKCILTTSKARSLLSASDEHDILMGHISDAGEGYVYVKPSTSLPTKYKRQSRFKFLFDSSYNEFVEKGLQAVFVLGQSRTGSAYIWKLAVVDKDNHQMIREIKKQVTATTEDNPVERLEVQAASNASNQILRYRLLPKRHLSFNDPKDLNYRIAESHFLRLALKSGKQYEIESIIYYVNPVLVRRFREKHCEFERRYGKRQESRDVLAFHGTDSQSIDNIIRENFKLEYCQRSMFGKGIYLSEFPHVSIHYGRSLLLCKVLPGRSHDVSHAQVDMPLRPGYDSHRVRADEDGYGWALVIDDPDQILPCYVINYRELDQSTPSPVQHGAPLQQPPPQPPPPVAQPPTPPAAESSCIVM